MTFFKVNNLSYFKLFFIYLIFFRLSELRKLNYALDVELQKERGQRLQQNVSLLSFTSLFYKHTYDTYQWFQCWYEKELCYLRLIVYNF